MQYAFDKAMDYGHDSAEVLDRITALLSQHQSLCCSASTQVGDLLIVTFEHEEDQRGAQTLIEFVSNT
jgi:hypothetical protein